MKLLLSVILYLNGGYREAFEIITLLQSCVVSLPTYRGTNVFITRKTITVL